MALAAVTMRFIGKDKQFGENNQRVRRRKCPIYDIECNALHLSSAPDRLQLWIDHKAAEPVSNDKHDAGEL